MFRSALSFVAFATLAACGVPSVERIGGNADPRDTDVETSNDPGNGVVDNDDNVDTVDNDDQDDSNTDDETDDTDDGDAMTFEVTLATDAFDDLDGDWNVWYTTDVSEGFALPADLVESGDSRILVFEANLESGDTFLLNGNGFRDDEEFWLMMNGDITNVVDLEVDNVEYIIDVTSAPTSNPEPGTCRIYTESIDLICREGTPDSDEDNNSDESEYCADDDDDGFGDSDDCGDYTDGDEPNGWVDNDDDCDDSDDEINPDADEVDDNVDNDCDGDVDDEDSNCSDCESDPEPLEGTEVTIMIEKESSWCDGEAWEPRFALSDDYDGDFELEITADDADEIEDEIVFRDGEDYRFQVWCDHDGDGSFTDANTWGLENEWSDEEGENVLTSRITYLEIDGEEYELIESEDSTPSARTCTIQPGDSHFICNIDL